MVKNLVPLGMLPFNDIRSQGNRRVEFAQATTPLRSLGDEEYTKTRAGRRLYSCQAVGLVG